MMPRVFLAVTLIIFLSGVVNAQIVFHFVPEAYARNVDGLFTFQMQNMSPVAVSGHVVISVKENRRGSSVVDITTPVVTVAKGMSSLTKNFVAGSIFKFGNNSYGQLVNQTRSFPAGEYNFCFTFLPVEKGDPEYDNCFDAAIEPLVPIQLLIPAEGDTICSKRPVLSWQPPMPYSGAISFRLMLTEKKQARNGVEAMLKNAPLLLLDNINSTTITYPSTYPELKEGVTYYWQVAAYQQNVIISTSEVWVFTVKCKDEPLTDNDSYRELKLLVNGNYYITSQYLKFSFLNNYNIKKLQYTIIDIEDGGKPVKYVPEVKLVQGLNKVDIDVTEIDLKQGRNYLLRVFPFNEPPVEMRFVYK